MKVAHDDTLASDLGLSRDAVEQSWSVGRFGFEEPLARKERSTVGQGSHYSLQPFCNVSPSLFSMKLFGWFKNDPESKGWVPGRAVAIPHYPRVESRSNAVENTSSANSVSTLSVTLRLLQPGDTAESVGSQYERLPIGVKHKTTNLPEGCYRLHCNVPNWVHLMVRQEGYVHKEHTEVPVWVNPVSGKIERIDKDKLLEELEPEKERAKHIWDEAGLFGKLDKAASTAAMADRSEDLGAFVGGLVGMAASGADTVVSIGYSPDEESSDPTAPNMSKYPPIEGVNFHLWVAVSVGLVKERIAPMAYDAFAQSKGVPAGRWAEIDKAWNARVASDWRLGALFGSEYEAAMKKK